MDWKSLFFTADGRIGREAFWIGWLMLLGANAVSHLIPVFGWALALAAFFASVCLYTKRLHDMGRSGWWQLLPLLFGPVVVGACALSVGGSAILSAFNDNFAPWAMMATIGSLLASLALAMVVAIGFTIWVGISEGQPGENRYGEPPLTPVLV